MMNVVFRVDSSIDIGSGHLMRCLTLAERYRKYDRADVVFICRDLPGNMTEIVRKAGFSVETLPYMDSDKELTGYLKWLTVSQEVDVKQTLDILRAKGSIDKLVIDSYAIDISWEECVRPFVREITVIDDLANRKHDCDVLVDQNFYLEKDSRYLGLVPEHCILQLGPEYAILREEFFEARKNLRKKNGTVNNILVFFGGVDLTNETQKTLQAIDALHRQDIHINVVVGSGNPHKEDIRKICCKSDNMRFLCQVNNMAQLMADADLAIGAGGTTIWERRYLNLDSIVVAVAENQIKICEDCNSAGMIDYLGPAEKVTVKDIKMAIESRL